MSNPAHTDIGDNNIKPQASQHNFETPPVMGQIVSTHPSVHRSGCRHRSRRCRCRLLLLLRLSLLCLLGLQRELLDRQLLLLLLLLVLLLRLLLLL